MAQYSVSRTWKEADLRISFAKMRSNPVDVATLSVASLEGLGPRHDQYFFAERQAQRDIATMMLLEPQTQAAALGCTERRISGIGPRPAACRQTGSLKQCSARLSVTSQAVRVLTRFRVGTAPTRKAGSSS